MRSWSTERRGYTPPFLFGERCAKENTEHFHPNAKAERNALSKSELEFFHSAHDFKKNLYKQLKTKML